MTDQSNSMDYENIDELPIFIAEPWKNWTEEEKNEINQQFNYHQDMIVWINQCWTNGPTHKPMPKKPNSSIMNKMYLVKNKVLNSNKTSVENMTDLEFHEYLTKKLADNAFIPKSGKSLKSTNLKEVAESLNEVYAELLHAEVNSLQVHLKLGKFLTFAKAKFDVEKRKKNLKQTWKTWLEENTKIKEACDRRHREIANLVLKYPKLENIKITYTELIDLKKKIMDVFTINMEIGSYWK